MDFIHSSNFVTKVRRQTPKTPKAVKNPLIIIKIAIIIIIIMR